MGRGGTGLLAAGRSSARALRATHRGPLTGTGLPPPIPRKYGDPVGTTPVSPRPRKRPVPVAPVRMRSPINGGRAPL